MTRAKLTLAETSAQLVAAERALEERDELRREAVRRIAERRAREEHGAFSWADWTSDRAARFELCTRWGRWVGLA